MEEKYTRRLYEVIKDSSASGLAGMMTGRTHAKRMNAPVNRTDVECDLAYALRHGSSKEAARAILFAMNWVHARNELMVLRHSDKEDTE